jgi:hypothetical protein
VGFEAMNHVGQAQLFGPLDLRDSGWADLVRSEMDTWYPERLRLRFQPRAPRAWERLAHPVPIALAAGSLGAAAAVALLKRRGRRR